MRGRVESIDVIQRELTAFARRARTKASQTHPGLTLVAHSMLDLIRERDGCRVADLAAHFLLDKSTVSRQVGDLERLGLLERQPDPDDRRGQVLRPTANGLTVLREAEESRRRAFTERFTDWPDEDVARFADYLARYGRRG